MKILLFALLLAVSGCAFGGRSNHDLPDCREVSEDDRRAGNCIYHRKTPEQRTLPREGL